MNILFFGDYDRDYARNRVLLRALRERSDVEMEEMLIEKRGIHRYMEVLRIRREVKKYDIVHIGYSDSLLLFVWSVLFIRKPIVWDMFYSRYDTLVYDRKLINRVSIRSLYYYILEWLMIRLVDVVLLDTKTHAKHIHGLFGGKKEKYQYVYVGTDESIFMPQEEQKGEEGVFQVGFYGKYIPLQGVEIIVEAARILKDKSIHFKLLGNGQTYDCVTQLVEKYKLSQVTFKERVPYEELPRFIASVDVMLGIFGTSDKAKSVIPNKVYEAMAVGSAIITGDTPATREVLRHGHDALLVPMGDPEALADAIKDLHKNRSKRMSLKEESRKTFLRKHAARLVGNAYTDIVSDVL